MKKRADATDKRLAQCEEVLFLTRKTVLDLMPEELSKILFSYPKQGSHKDVADWMHRVTEEIVSRAELSEPRPYDQDRAMCPLCRRGSNQPYTSGGFTWPEGLRRHLQGGGNAYLCSVMQAALGLAYWSCNEPHLIRF